VLGFSRFRADEGGQGEWKVGGILWPGRLGGEGNVGGGGPIRRGCERGGVWSVRGEEGPGRGTDPGAADASSAACRNRGGVGASMWPQWGGCWAICYGLGRVNNAFSKLNQIVSMGLELIQSKDGLLLLNKFQIKYTRERF
jgi:hypothetical protein